MTQIEILQELEKHPEGVLNKNLKYSSQMKNLIKRKEIMYVIESIKSESYKGHRNIYRFFITEIGRNTLKNYNPIILNIN